MSSENESDVFILQKIFLKNVEKSRKNIIKT